MYIYLCALCLVVMVLFIRQEHSEKYVSAVILKGLASLCFVLFGILSSKLCPDSDFSRLIVTGLVLGMIADVLLNLRFVLKKAGQKIFLVGILVFLSGHILYLAALIPKCGNLWLCIAIGIVLTALILWRIFKHISAKPAFKIFGVFYIGAIVIMNCVALGAYITSPSASSAVFVAGAVLFLISDIVLILNTFGSESKFSLRITNLSLYYLGQLMIALSLQL